MMQSKQARAEVSHVINGGGVCNRGVLAAAASGLSDFISDSGGDVDRIFGVSGIDPELLAQPTLSLGLINYCRVMEEAARDSDCDNFGLHYGRQFKPQSLGLIGYIGLCSPTLEQALHNVASAFPWHQHDTLTRLVDKGDCWRLDYQVRHGAILCRRQDAELTLGMFLNLIRHVAGRNWAPREVHFEHPRPSQWHEHCKVFDAPVWFDQPFNSLVIPKRDMARAMPDSDPLLLGVMQDAIRRLNSGCVQQKIVDLARVQVHQALLQGEPLLEEVAEKMGLTSWSLQRRLREEGLSFTSLVDNVRCEMAKYYLQQHQLPISEMALLLGYSEVSAFSRAFRRWFSISPRQWRQEERRG
ncbi:AraC family transcriptional regulator [Erwinia amylovora]|uniref:Ornithine utilization regulator n=5 Tax=Erwinia amylovora TaxID=552 RepID=A0A831ERK8_ERWAM|nr:AraC family transcriptional regulator [Erwinia amylovora]CBX79779.1 Ornithine utilization regulator [Erwinia amylovora ATCC BAA-2158]CDK14497.1 Ornithine utilization regulator [Erwinia amylovora LA635]CDK17864.1 Ornithine utilization regulator [Erwinia amylovora LA636]CDK21233.1 Ornithine utilization regulator [Erwinia amylovora LA637]ATZ10833.1 AraC family transcriptional regulator [Erwinia amylovora]